MSLSPEGSQTPKPPEIFMDPFDKVDQARMEALADKIKAQGTGGELILLPADVQEPLADPAIAAGRIIQFPRGDHDTNQAA